MSPGQRIRVWAGLCLAVVAWAEPKLPDGPGKATFENVCGACHSAAYVVGRKGTERSWQKTIDKMIASGAQASPEQWTEVKAYLASQFSYAPGEFKLPEGVEKALVERV